VRVRVRRWLSGEAGVGKTALLEYLAANASGCRIARIAGVQSEMELPFAALHQLCAPSLDQLQGLPVPPRPDPRLLLIAAAEPVGDPALVWGAAAPWESAPRRLRRRPTRA
jgi:hypothetical protein